LTTKVEINGVEEDIDIPINLNFFWPDLWDSISSPYGFI
jgi:hypothetical protein